MSSYDTLQNIIHGPILRSIQWPRGLRRWYTGSRARIPLRACPWSLYAAMSCAGRGLATSWSLIQGVPPYVENWLGNQIMEARTQTGLQNQWWININHLKPKLVYVILKNRVRTAKKKRTLHFSIIKINWLTLFKKIITVNPENHMKHTNTDPSVTDRRNTWVIQLP
jgi:hypothetical protein